MEQGLYYKHLLQGRVSMDMPDEVLYNHYDTWICKKTYLIHLRSLA